MAAPNLANLTTIIGKTAVANLSSTNATLVVENTAASNKVFKINALYVSNVDGATSAEITVNLYSGANLGGTATQIVSTVTVPADSTLVVIDRDGAIYLEEDRSIGATASAANDLKVVCSYEELS